MTLLVSVFLVVVLNLSVLEKMLFLVKTFIFTSICRVCDYFPLSNASFEFDVMICC